MSHISFSAIFSTIINIFRCNFEKYGKETENIRLSNNS